MILVLLQSFLILINSYYFSKKLKLEFASIFFIFNSLLVSILYILSIFNLLWFGLIITNILIFIIFGFFIYQERSFEFIYNHTFIISFVLTIVGLFFFKNLYVFGWDDLNHWALLSKELYYLKKLLVPESQVILNYYPPGMSIYQYFFIGFQKFYREDILFYANYFLLISALMTIISPILKKIKNYKSYLSIFLTLSIAMSIYGSFGAEAQKLYVDYFLGIYLVALIALYINLKYFNKYLTLIPLFFFPLIKGTGFIFSLFFIALVGILELFNNKDFKNKFSSIVIYSLISLFIVFISKYSWVIFFENTFDGNIPNPSFKFSNLIQMFLNPIGRDEIILTNYFEALFKREILSLSKFILFNLIFRTNLHGLTIYGFFIYLIFLLVILVFYSKNKSIFKLTLIISIAFLILNVLYHFSLIGMYRYIFSSHEGNNLASFDRYLATINLATIFMIYFLYIKNFDEVILAHSIFHKKNILLLIIFLFINLFITGRYFLIYKTESLDKNYLEDVQLNLTNLKKSSNKEILKIYILDQGSPGYGFRKVRYFIYPNHSNPGTHSIGKKYYDEDIWTQDITLEQWADTLVNQNYDYIYFLNTDLKFWEIYGSIFRGNIGDSKLWKINKTNNDKIELIPMQNSNIF